MDSVRSSNNIPQEDMSYLFGRDPSILAHGQRPCISDGTKKNLLSVYEIEESNSAEEYGSVISESRDLQTVKVYLRMKPFPRKMKLTQEQQNAYNIISTSALFTRLPTLDNNTSCLKRSNSTDIVCRKFTFTRTFGAETTQLELFEQAVKQQMVEFLSGQNCTIMTYGTTNSGKSYTLQGTTTSPGIIPRCLEFVFSNITPKSTPSYKPMNHCDVVCLDPLERAQELEIKTKLLTFASVDKHQYINAYKEMQKLLQEESPIRPSQCIDAHYSVWVSFAEIYNEIVYDLLSNECQKKRTPLKLATDSQGRAFIKGLKTVCVNSGSEAYQVLMAGQYNLKVAATALNARSSRSHCIFTIKLLKYYIENDNDSVEVSTFAFCDLAGSERLKKTLNIGDRLKEAQNINTSLLVLGRCLKTIHDVQLSKQKIELVGPFRESKLTRLFQKALSGKEHLALIVNINPVPNLYIETQNVLNFSAIAKQIVLEQKEKMRKKKRSRFSQIVTQSIKTVTDWDATELESEEWQNTVDENATSGYVPAEDYEEILGENERLKKEIAILKSSTLSRDLQIRQEMADTYTAIMKQLELEWKNRIKDVEEQQEDVLQWSVKQVEDFYKQKLDQVSSRKRSRASLVDNNLEDDSKNIQEMEAENSRLTSKIVLLKSSAKELKEANQILSVEKNKVTFELSLTKEDLKTVKNLLNSAQEDVCSDDDAKCYIAELKTQLFAKQEQVKKLKVFLNEAKEEYIAITTEVREKEYIIKEQEEDLLEKQETIDYLEADLEHINICLSEKIKAVEVLEDKLESQNKKMAGHTSNMQVMHDQINALENEKLIRLDDIELLKKAALNRHSVKAVEVKNEASETYCDFPEGQELQEIILKDEVLALPYLEVLDKPEENDENHTETGNQQPPDTQMADKIITIEAENSALKEKLTQSMTEIQSLKEDLEAAKVKLQDISDQICNLQINSDKPTIENDEPVVPIEVAETAEIGCQVDIEPVEPQTTNAEPDLKNRSCQTIECIGEEEVIQTSIIGETGDHDIILDELARRIVKYDDVKSQHEEKCLMLEKLNEEILSLRQRVETLSEESNANNVVVEEYKESIALLQKELSVVSKEEMTRLEQALRDSDIIKVSLEKKIEDYEQRLNETEKELSLTKSDYSQCSEKFTTLQVDFDSHTTKLRNDHEETMSNLQKEVADLKKELSVEVERNDIKSQCLDVHVSKIMELEHNLEGIGELHRQIEKLNMNLETCRAAKEHVQRLLDKNSDKLLEFEDRLEQAKEKERDKEAEITSLQKEMKRMIQRSESDDKSDKLMEAEMKNTLRDLTDTKLLLSRREERIQNLEIRLKSSEQNAKILDLLQQSAHERQADNERLRNLNEELKNSLTEKEREMEAFMKHRDEMVGKYENLVKDQQQELEKQKRVLPKAHKDYCENTSEDEVVQKERRVRRPPKRYDTSPKPIDASVIELSGSETKRSGKRTALPPPLPGASADRKRNARKKKLYLTADESFQDIEPIESSITITPATTPATTSRSLRSRRK